jgi:CHASE1-domain containing sensor protein
LSRNLDIEFPGTRGFGFIRRVSRKNETEFLNKARADDMPDFTIKEFAPHNAERYVVQYLEPQNRNLATIGIDIASEASRRIALKQALQSGTATLTPPLSIVQSSGLPLYSFLLLLPVYHLAMPLETAEQREAATLGLSFTAIAIDTVLQQSKITNNEIALQISDMAAKQVFYSSSDFADLAEVSQQAVFRRTVFGRNWEFRLRAEPTFYKHHERLSSVWLASFIIICAFLSSVLLYLSSVYRRRLIAESEEQKQLVSIVENAHDAIISLNLDAVVTSWNKAADRMFDFSAEDAIGKKIADLIIPFR